MYLLHAYYRENKIECRYFSKTESSTNRKFDRTKKGAYKYWELERCLNYNNCPIDSITKSNLLFLIGLRHEIEHQMTRQIDDYLSARFQACCLNFNQYIKELFGEKYSIEKHLSFSLQFSSIDEAQHNQLREFDDLPKNIASFINDFDKALSDEYYNDIKYSYRVLYVPKLVNRKGQADKVIEFISADSPIAQGLNKAYTVIKEREKNKYLPKTIVDTMNSIGYENFKMHHYVELWKKKDAKNPNKNYGVLVVDKWYWYENWVNEVKRYCIENKEKFRKS